MSKKLVITEKPSVASDIAAALSIKKKQKGYFEGEDYLITWAIGHLLELQDPEDMDKKYKSWLLKDLPIIPEKFKWKVSVKVRALHAHFLAHPNDLPVACECATVRAVRLLIIQSR